MICIYFCFLKLTYHQLIFKVVFKILQASIEMNSLPIIKVVKAVKAHYSPIDTSIGAEGDFVCQTAQPEHNT